MTGAVLAAFALLVGGCAATGDDGDGARGTTGERSGGARAAAFVQPGDESPPSVADGITVIGTGRITGAPDTLRTTVGVEVERDGVDTALAAANEAAQRVIDAVRDAGVAEEDVQTREFSVEPRYDHPNNGQPVLRGYVVRNLVEVKIREPDRAGDVLTAATEAGGDDARVRGVRFALEDNDALLDAARERAFEDARSRAEQYAELAGRGLGPLVSVSEHLSTPPPAEHFDAGAAREAAPGAVPVQPGQQEVQVQVTAVWTLD
ncbi:MAG: SIMPL domain-containing protein [Actinobacteria bacterium]|nr:SIMPL domain-containing protein [Actinomycetota bacterium]